MLLGAVLVELLLIVLQILSPVLVPFLQAAFLAAIHPPHAIRKILTCLGLPPRPPPVAPALPDCEMNEMYAS